MGVAAPVEDPVGVACVSCEGARVCHVKAHIAHICVACDAARVCRLALSILRAVLGFRHVLWLLVYRWVRTR